jgi:hypothetical protein
MSVLDVQIWLRGDVSDLGLTDGYVGLLRGVDCDNPTQSLIGLIKYSYHRYTTFPEVQLQRTRLSVLDLEQFKNG